MNIEEYFNFGGKYVIKDGLIYTDGFVQLIKKVTKLPLPFGKVGHNFNCFDNQLTTLEGAPTSVSDNFDCSYNQLSSLIGAPTSVGGDFYCHNNPLTSLEGAPKSIGSYFIIDWSKDLLMLRLLMYKKIVIYENNQVKDIFQKYLNQPNKKKAILDCQKELIDNGFVGNAGW